MVVEKYFTRQMYGFLKDEEGHTAFFHLGTFVPGKGEKEDPIPPIPGEPVDVDVDFPSGEEGKPPRASWVYRTQLPSTYTGTVTRFDTRVDYGNISCGNELYFLHRSEVRGGKVPLVGDSVQFHPGVRDGKLRACHVLVKSRGE